MEYTSNLRELINSDPDSEWLTRNPVRIPLEHEILRWACTVPNCTRPLDTGRGQFCTKHQTDFENRGEFVSIAEYRETAPIASPARTADRVCRICPERPVFSLPTGLCRIHYDRYRKTGRNRPSLEDWAKDQVALPSLGICAVHSCIIFASQTDGLCDCHRASRKRARKMEGLNPGQTVDSNEVWDANWLRSEWPVTIPGQLNMTGLPSRLADEFRYILVRHRDNEAIPRWRFSSFQQLINLCRDQGVQSLMELGVEHGFEPAIEGHNSPFIRMIIVAGCPWLRQHYYTPEDARKAGFFETLHYGLLLNGSTSTIDLRSVRVEWIRNLVWDYIEHRIVHGPVPKTRGVFDSARRAAREFSAFLSLVDLEDRPSTTVDDEVIRQFCIEYSRRADNSEQSLSITDVAGTTTRVTPVTRKDVLVALRQLLHFGATRARSSDVSVNPRSVAGFPTLGPNVDTSRRPFSDQVARALADEANLQLLRDKDPNDRGIANIWEIQIATGRRSGEVTSLSLDCADVYDGLPILWHDQTKVGRLDEAVRIPAPIYDLICERREKSLERFRTFHGRLPSEAERRHMKLFPSAIRYNMGETSISNGYYQSTFGEWVDELDIGSAVPHQARHTLATSLMRNGANLTQIRRFLGHVSDRMAERYTRIAHKDLESALSSVWVSGPGSDHPGELLQTPATKAGGDQVRRMVVDLSRSVTPTIGGVSAFQPVIDGKRCPFSLDCENCQHLILSGGDLMYWRRKREQWLRLAERAPEKASRDFILTQLEPVSRALRGLEAALDAIGLLKDAEAIDLGRPQEFFRPVWSYNFRVDELAELDSQL